MGIAAEAAAPSTPKADRPRVGAAQAAISGPAAAGRPMADRGADRPTAIPAPEPAIQGRGPAMAARVGGFRFSRGQILPPSYRGGVISDYGRYHLRRPPRGYYWYRAGDDFVLVAVATGMIFDVIGAEGY